MEDFETSDLYLASVLHSLGYGVIEVDRTNPKVIFRFKGDKKLNREIEKYRMEGLLVPVPQLWASFSYLKDLLYAGKE